MTFEEIKKLIKQFDDSSLNELKYSVEGESITLKKSGENHPVYTQPIMVHPQAMSVQTASTMPGAVAMAPGTAAGENGVPATGVPFGAPGQGAAGVGPGGAAGAGGAAEQSGGDTSAPGVEVITSPIVGTFYRSPSPDSPPFCQDGDVVEKGNTICILEAMKVMNELEAEFKMEIVSFHVNNGDMVEYGTPICEVRRV